MATEKFDPLYFAPTSLLPKGFKYPSAFLAYVDSNPPSVIGPANEDFCGFLEGEIERYFEYLQSALPGRRLVPFMRRNGDDGVVCFDADDHGDDPMVWYCNVFQGLGAWPLNVGFAGWLATIPPADRDE